MADRAFILKEVHGHPQYRAVIISSDSVKDDEVVIEWSHAVRYTAKGLDVPDYDAAIASIAQRHPDWRVSQHPITTIAYDPSKADLGKKA